VRTVKERSSGEKQGNAACGSSTPLLHESSTVMHVKVKGIQAFGTRNAYLGRISPVAPMQRYLLVRSFRKNSFERMQIVLDLWKGDFEVEAQTLVESSNRRIGEQQAVSHDVLRVCFDSYSIKPNLCPLSSLPPSPCNVCKFPSSLAMHVQCAQIVQELETRMEQLQEELKNSIIEREELSARTEHSARKAGASNSETQRLVGQQSRYALQLPLCTLACRELCTKSLGIRVISGTISGSWACEPGATIC
jgi:hypothetical protein